MSLDGSYRRVDLGDGTYRVELISDAVAHHGAPAVVVAAPSAVALVADDGRNGAHLLQRDGPTHAADPTDRGDKWLQRFFPQEVLRRDSVPLTQGREDVPPQLPQSRENVPPQLPQSRENVPPQLPQGQENVPAQLRKGRENVPPQLPQGRPQAPDLKPTPMLLYGGGVKDGDMGMQPGIAQGGFPTHTQPSIPMPGCMPIPPPIMPGCMPIPPPKPMLGCMPIPPPTMPGCMPIPPPMPMPGCMPFPPPTMPGILPTMVYYPYGLPMHTTVPAHYPCQTTGSDLVIMPGTTLDQTTGSDQQPGGMVINMGIYCGNDAVVYHMSAEELRELRAVTGPGYAHKLATGLKAIGLPVAWSRSDWALAPFLTSELAGSVKEVGLSSLKVIAAAAAGLAVGAAAEFVEKFNIVRTKDWSARLQAGARCAQVLAALDPMSRYEAEQYVQNVKPCSLARGTVLKKLASKLPEDERTRLIGLRGDGASDSDSETAGSRRRKLESGTPNAKRQKEDTESEEFERKLREFGETGAPQFDVRLAARLES